MDSPAIIALMAALLHLAPQPAHNPYMYHVDDPAGSQICVQRSGGKPAFVCWIPWVGRVTGALTTPGTNRIKCGISGTFDGSCLHVTVCNAPQVVCGGNE
jgi:hypothetical protein